MALMVFQYDCAGVHVGQSDLPASEARKLIAMIYDLQKNGKLHPLINYLDEVI